MGKVISAHAVVYLVADDGLDGGSSFEFAHIRGVTRRFWPLV
jgi:hypothetical protein